MPHHASVSREHSMALLIHARHLLVPILPSVCFGDLGPRLLLDLLDLGPRRLLDLLGAVQLVPDLAELLVVDHASGLERRFVPLRHCRKISKISKKVN